MNYDNTVGLRSNLIICKQISVNRYKFSMNWFCRKIKRVAVCTQFKYKNL